MTLQTNKDKNTSGINNSNKHTKNTKNTKHTKDINKPKNRYITYLFLGFTFVCLIYPFVKHLIPEILRYKKEDSYCDLVYSECYRMVNHEICSIFDEPKVEQVKQVEKITPIDYTKLFYIVIDYTKIISCMGLVYKFVPLWKIGCFLLERVYYVCKIVIKNLMVLIYLHRHHPFSQQWPKYIDIPFIYLIYLSVVLFLMGVVFVFTMCLFVPLLIVFILLQLYHYYSNNPNVLYPIEKISFILEKLWRILFIFS